MRLSTALVSLPVFALAISALVIPPVPGTTIAGSIGG